MEDGTVEPPPATPQGTPVTGELELPKEIEVNYTDNGFNPVIAIVEQGATVKFTNNSRITMWIASDPHPTHDMYKGFDAKTAVPPGAAYSFTFTRVGSWKYHNDTATSHTGTITVE
jgi:plastocyanin